MLYYSFLELYTKGYASTHPEFKDEIVQKAAGVFRGNPRFQGLLEKISNEIEERLAESLEFIRRLQDT